MVKDQKKGFTIIEVVLVLAIAGLIFLMVFVALPALQRGQRDGQRRNDITRFMSQITSYSTNNRNSVPNSAKIPAFLRDYMKQDEGEFRDPKTGENYIVLTGIDKTPATNTIVYANGAKCNGEEFQAVSGARNVAVRIQLEGSGVYCQDNQ
ncbi:hypothetical protein CR969_02270 [Candidatus Saccharibacteria bacterium]|nr:MAG: hypothetical protein CR969_02270 [Candidatus Saccharibacteria bacterium]